VTHEYESERTVGREGAAAVFEGVANGLATGAVRLGEDTDGVVVRPPAAVDLEIELETEDGETSLELELEWPAGSGEVVPIADADGVSSDDGASSSADTDDSASEGDDPVPGMDDDPVPEANDGPDPETDDPPSSDASAESLSRFELFVDRAGEWRWRLRHRNGNVIATSGEGYTRKHNAKKGARSVMRNAAGAAMVEE
jgi:amphi-Trp domain-containing protein